MGIFKFLVKKASDRDSQSSDRISNHSASTGEGSFETVADIDSSAGKNPLVNLRKHVWCYEEVGYSGWSEQYQTDSTIDVDSEQNSEYDEKTSNAESLDVAASRASSIDLCCPICLGKVTQESTLRCIPCRHAFHTECLDSWISQGHNSCPTCRRVLVQITPKPKNTTEEPSASTSTGAALSVPTTRNSQYGFNSYVTQGSPLLQFTHLNR